MFTELRLVYKLTVVRVKSTWELDQSPLALQKSWHIQFKSWKWVDEFELKIYKEWTVAIVKKVNAKIPL